MNFNLKSQGQLIFNLILNPNPSILFIIQVFLIILFTLFSILTCLFSLYSVSNLSFDYPSEKDLDQMFGTVGFVHLPCESNQVWSILL